MAGRMAQAWAAMIFGLAAAMAASAGAAPIDRTRATPVTVVMAEYSFTPDHLTFHLGTAYRLHLENKGKELHEFTAPAFFQAVTLDNPDVLSNGGQQIEVAPGATRDAYFVPKRAGHFDLTCADHDWAGMTGTIVIE